MDIINKEVVKNKKVLLRVDFNVPLNEKREITDNSRIKKALRTIIFLLENDAQIVIISHFGRVKAESDKEKYSLEVVAKELCNLLGRKVAFIKETNFESVYSQINDLSESVILLENTRFYDLQNQLESNCADSLSKFYASLADIYINDAFGASHRKHASTYGVKAYLPSYYGFLIDEELNELNALVNIKKRPFTVFMGGAKVEDKLLIIKNLLNKCDYLCLGGGILNSFLKANGFDVLDSLCTEDEKVLKDLKDLLNNYPEKIKLSYDLVWCENKILDIDVSVYKEYISESKIIFVNGTPGMYENSEYQNGTIQLFEMLKESNAKVIAGGGDTASALKKFNLDFDFVSSGGGASVEYIANGFLPALED